MLNKRMAVLNLKTLYFLLFSVVLFIECNPVIRENIQVRYPAILFMCWTAVVYFLRCGRIKVNIFWAWSIIVLGYMFTTSLWGINAKDTIQAVKNLLIVSLITAMTSLMIENIFDIKKVIYGIIFAYGAETMYVLSRIDLFDLGRKRIGSDYIGLSQWNANAIGSFTAIGCIFSVLCLLKKKQRRKKYIIEAFLILFFGSIMLLTGSRKALIIIVGTIFLFVCFYNGEHKRWRNIFLAALAGILLFVFIMINDELYMLIGARIVRLIQELTGYKTGENSMSLRKSMIFSGLQWFLQKPVLGYGLDGFAEMYGQSKGWKVYSHCNFIEILVGGGLVGFFLYYFIYIYILDKLRKRVFEHYDIAETFIFSLLLVLLFNNAALVCYADIIYISIIMLAGSYLKFQIQGGS